MFKTLKNKLEYCCIACFSPEKHIKFVDTGYKIKFKNLHFQYFWFLDLYLNLRLSFTKQQNSQCNQSTTVLIMESMQCICYLGNRPEHRQSAISVQQKNSPIMLVNKVRKSTNQKHQSQKYHIRAKLCGNFYKGKKKKPVSLLRATMQISKVNIMNRFLYKHKLSENKLFKINGFPPIFSFSIFDSI